MNLQSRPIVLQYDYAYMDLDVDHYQGHWDLGLVLYQ